MVAVSPLGVVEESRSAREAVDAMVEAGLLDQLFEQIDDGGLQLTCRDSDVFGRGISLVAEVSRPPRPCHQNPDS